MKNSITAVIRTYAVAIVCVTSIVVTVESLNTNPLLLLISMDGFRYDLLNASVVPNIWKFASEGVYFKRGCRPQYLSYTAPNHASIATGLLVESHGIVGNFFYDLATNTTFDLFNTSKKEGIVNASLESHFYNGEPIWLTNERLGSGRRSASINWPTGSAYWPPAPHRPTLYRPWLEYKNLTQWIADFDEIIQLFTHEKEPFNFIAWYMSEPDHVLHLNGFKNGQLAKVLWQLDLLFKYISEKLKNYSDLEKRLNIILTADHGHAEIEGTSNVLCLLEVISGVDILFGDRMIYVKDINRREQVYAALKKAIDSGHYRIKLYRREDVPPAYGYSRNSNIGDILIEPEPGYNVRVNCSHHDDATMEPFHSSSHGMNPNHWTMRSILVMKGPAFKQKYKVDVVANNIDLYPLMCHILGLLPAPNNGSLLHMFEVLKMPRVSNVVSVGEIKVLTIMTCGMPLLLLLIFAVMAVRRRRWNTMSKHNYHMLSERLNRISAEYFVDRNCNIDEI